MVNVSLVSQTMGNPTVKDIVNLNKAVKMLKDSSDAVWRFCPSALKLEEAIIYVFAGSSLGFTNPHIVFGNKIPLHVLETYSGSINRVCGSTLAAEASGFLPGWKPQSTCESRVPSTPRARSIACFTDARSLEQTLNSEDPRCPGERVPWSSRLP